MLFVTCSQSANKRHDDETECRIATECVRLEGYLTNGDFTAALINGLGRSAFIRKQYADAER